MRSSSTSSSRIARSRIAAAAGAAARSRDNARHARPASATPCSRSATCSRPARRSSCSRSACSPSPTGCSTRRRRSQVVLATGQDQGAYAEFGKRYAQILKEHGIEVRLRKTQARPRTSPCCASPAATSTSPSSRAAPTTTAGAEAATRRRRRHDGLVSLGSLFYEPVWLFYRSRLGRAAAEDARAHQPAQLAGWRVNIGAPGSGVPNLMARLLEANRLDAGDDRRCSSEPQTPAVVGLLDGRIDALVLRLGARVADGADAAADARHPPVRLRAGRGLRAALSVLEPGDAAARRRRPGADLPPADVRLVAPTATLVARKGTHPALIQLFVQAAQQVHGGAGWFQNKGDFPSPRTTPSGRWPRKRSASTRAARRCCSATCRSGSPTWSTACGWCW